MRVAAALSTAILFSVLAMTDSAAAAHPLTIDDLLAMRRVSDPHISPDGKSVVYAMTTVDREKNTSTSTIWLAPTDGGSPRQLTGGPKHDKHPRFSPDSRQVLFESDRSGDNQLWIIDLSGGEARQLTTIASEATKGIWSPDGKWVGFYLGRLSRVFASAVCREQRRPQEA